MTILYLGSYGIGFSILDNGDALRYQLLCRRLEYEISDSGTAMIYL